MLQKMELILAIIRATLIAIFFLFRGYKS